MTDELTGLPNRRHVLDRLSALLAQPGARCAVVIADDDVRYRLLETTRVYALEKLERSGEMVEIADRHARYCSSVLAGIVATDPGSAADHLGNIRAALDWELQCGRVENMLRATSATPRSAGPMVTATRTVTTSAASQFLVFTSPQKTPR